MQSSIIPEQQFFDNPALDRAFGVVIALATEVYVLRDRQRAIERALANTGTINLDTLNAEPSEEERVANKLDRDKFVKHLMENLLGAQASKGLK